MNIPKKSKRLIILNRGSTLYPYINSNENYVRRNNRIHKVYLVGAPTDKCIILPTRKSKSMVWITAWLDKLVGASNKTGPSCLYSLKAVPTKKQ
jgi:hypothetical protein